MFSLERRGDHREPKQGKTGVVIPDLSQNGHGGDVCGGGGRREREEERGR